MRKLFKYFILVIVTVCIGFAYYSKTYAIKNDKEVIKNRLMQFINRPDVITNNIDIRQELDIDNKKYVFFVINGNLGFAELTKGINNKYKIDYTECGGGSFRDRIIKTNKGKYLILMGENLDNKVAYVKVVLESTEYKITIPQQEYYIVNCSVPAETEITCLDYNSIKFYNKNDDDITVEIFKSKF